MSLLPDNPGDLIRLALDDLEKTEEDSRYEVNMSFWHEFFSASKVCVVCLAGSVMAQRLSPTQVLANLTPSDYDGDTRRKLTALNSFREGRVTLGLLEMQRGSGALTPALYHRLLDHVPQYFPITPYGEDSAAFKRGLLALADLLDNAMRLTDENAS